MRRAHKKNFLAPKSLIVFIIVAISFYMLWTYRQNDPLPAGVKVKDFEFKTLDGQTFSTKDINATYALVFLNTRSVFSNGIYHNAYLNRMHEIKELQRSRKAFVIVVVETEQTEENIRNLLKKKKYKILENIVYLGKIEELAQYYGINSWPHFFMIDETKTIIYQSKMPSINKIIRVLRGI